MVSVVWIVETDLCFVFCKAVLYVQAMESKLLRGGTNIVDHTNEQQRALEQRRQEIADEQVTVQLTHVVVSQNVFSAWTLLVVCREGHPACVKNPFQQSM